MKLTAILLTICSLTVTARSVSQSINFSGKNVDLEKVFSVIEKQTGYYILYKKSLLEQTKPITVEAIDISLNDFLAKVFEGQPLIYAIHKTSITVEEKRSAGHVSTLPISFASLTRPPITLRGRIVNESGEPVVASIIIKGTNRGTTSNSDGSFILENIEENSVLLISGIAIETQVVNVKGRSAIDINVITKIGSEEEVVVKTTYWETKKRLNPGNISRVTSKQIEVNPVSNPIAALQARVPGLEIVQQTGVPGGGFKVRIRGTNSIPDPPNTTTKPTNLNDPLYIVDGVPYTSTSMAFNETSGQILNLGTSPLNNINPADIETIDVLKDADATAIYGSRGANGVILITTKRGKSGKTKVDFNYYTGWGKVASKIDLLNTQQYIAMRKEAFANDNVIPTTANARDLLVWDQNHQTDWQKELIGGTAKYTDAQVSFSGGNQFTQFRFGGGYHRETTVFPGDNSDQRVSTQFSLNNVTPNQKLKTSVSINYSASNSNLLNQDLTSRALILAPNAPALYKENGELNWDGWEPSFNGSGLENPVAYLNRRYEVTTNALIGNASIGYSILNNLEIKTNLGYTNTTMNASNRIPLSALHPSEVPTSFNTTSFSNSKFQNWLIEPQINWRPKIGKGQFDVLMGTQFLSQTTEGLAQTATGFTSEALMLNISSAANRTLGTNYYAQYHYAAVFGRLNYTLDKKYIINITGRRDGSSRFGPGKQFGNFGAIGTAWVFSNEGFIQKVFPFLSFGKIRASYGISGSDQLSDYQYLDSYTSSSGPYQGVIRLTPQRLSNADFAWESNKKLETGLELGFINDRLLASFSYYRNRSSNQLVGQPLPAITGFTSIQVNLPATVQNRGLEIELNTRNIEGKNFFWSSSINVSIPRNKLISFPNLNASLAYNDLYEVGQPLSIRKVYHYLGIDPATGIYNFQDANNDGTLNADDWQTIEFLGANYFGGFQNSFKYKSLQLDILFQFVKQTGRNYLFYTSIPGFLSNQPTLILNNYWQKAGDNSEIQKFTQQYSTASEMHERLQLSDRFITDASFVRLKNISLEWSLPKGIINKIHAENARLFIRGQNLFTITNFKGLDAESQSSGLPPLKVFVVGINVSF